jgi:hypothetical protein
VRLELPESDSQDPFTFSSVSLKGHLMRMTFCSEAGTARQRVETVAQDSQGPFTLSSISLNKLTLRFQGWHKAAKLRPKVKYLAEKKTENTDEDDILQ